MSDPFEAHLRLQVQLRERITTHHCEDERGAQGRHRTVTPKLIRSVRSMRMRRFAWRLIRTRLHLGQEVLEEIRMILAREERTCRQ